jgi:hypothetical protein
VCGAMRYARPDAPGGRAGSRRACPWRLRCADGPGDARTRRRAAHARASLTNRRRRAAGADQRGGGNDRARREQRPRRSDAGQPEQDASPVPGRGWLYLDLGRRGRDDLGPRRRWREPLAIRLEHAGLSSGDGPRDAARLQRRQDVHLPAARRSEVERWLGDHRRRLRLRLRAGQPRRQSVRPTRHRAGHRELPRAGQGDDRSGAA